MAKIKHWGDPPYWRISREFEMRKMSGKASLVMMSLASHMNDNSHECFISYKTLIAETHMGSASLVKALRELREHGFVGKSRRFSKSNVYVLIIPSELALPDSQEKARRSRTGTKSKRNTQTPQRPPLKPPFYVDPNLPAEDYYG